MRLAEVIFSHQDEPLGPPGTEEWQASFRDSGGNLAALVEHRAPA